MIYLASPYTHQDSRIKEQRFQAVSKMSAHLMRQGFVIFSPIAMCHPMSVHGGLPGNWEFWEKFDTEFIIRCSEFWVLTLEGWQTSKGVKAEHTIAQRYGKIIKFINPLDAGLTTHE